ncbi:Probable calcium-binding protein CML16 [Zea mays]|jgi:calcium-binding protein CML|nr:Probable calcium-binding protein CML16 [Zea mays]ONM30204.1 putative calcium-binding protein CML27 [Zea mays]|eukprot:NP_001334783.1 uncharacterized protein LOC103649813 [Zea mays]
MTTSMSNSAASEKQSQQAGHRQRPPAASAADAEMQRVFCRIDADGDGRISASELAAVTRAISPPASSSHGRREVAAMMDELDTDRDGFVDLGEFRAFHARGGGGVDDDAELRAAFDVYDVDGDGRVTAAELGKVLARIGEGGCSAEECERMVAGVDADGCVGFEDFKKMMCPQPQAEAGAAGRDKAEAEAEDKEE